MGNRVWIEDFARRHFDSTSVFVYTDSNRTTGWVGDTPGDDSPAAGVTIASDLGPERGRFHTPLGPFDKSLTWEGEGFVPTSHRDKIFHIDKSYFELMANCRYALTPAGDSPWSIRFYEALALGVIPVVRSALSLIHQS